MDMIGRIRRLHVRDKLSEREIARMTGLSRNTVSKWLQRQKLRPGQFGWEATRKTLTSKIETLSMSHGAVESNGETIFHPQGTRLVLALPDTAAVNFRFEFNVVDDRE